MSERIRSGMPLHEYVIFPIYHDESFFSFCRRGEDTSLRQRVPLIQGRGISDEDILNRNEKFPHTDM